MSNSDFRYLNFNRFVSMTNWSVRKKLVISTAFTDAKEIKLSKLINRVKKVMVIDDNTEYKRVTIKLYGKGVILRNIEIGKNIKTKRQFVVEAGQFILSRIDARNGAFGIVPDELNGAIITNDFWVFNFDPMINPKYLLFLLSSTRFETVWGNQSSGATNRQRIEESNFLDMEIYLPSLEIQERIVKNYINTQYEAEKAKGEAEELEISIDNVILNELGFIIEQDNQIEEIANNSYLYSINYSETDRWSVDYLLSKSKKGLFTDGKYKSVSAKQFIKYFQYGLSEKADDNSSGIPMLRMNNIFNSEIVIDKLKYLNLNDKIKNKFLLNKGDLIFNRTNSKELVGKTAVFELDGMYTFASYLIRVEVNTSIASVHYINLLFNSRIIRTQIDIISRQVLGQANINSEELKNFLFPLPPIEIQNNIVDKVLTIKNKIKTLLDKSEYFKKEAMREFEESVFGET